MRTLAGSALSDPKCGSEYSLFENGGGMRIHMLIRSTALGSALLAGSAINLFGWDMSKPETFADVNTAGSKEFKPSLPDEEREQKWSAWKRAVERCRGWEDGIDEECPL